MISGSTLTLIAWGVLLFFILLGFLIGCLRGFRKSLFFTIVYIVTLILSFILAMAIAKSLYGGPAIWNAAKGQIPESMIKGCEGATSLKEFVRLYLLENYKQVLDSGVTVGESVVNNPEAMAMVDGIVILVLKLVLFIVLYIALTIIFYLFFGLVYLLFLRPKTYIETVTTTDEDGNEFEEEREVKPKKRRLIGGAIGGVKGLVKAMVILIPISSLIGVVATLEVPSTSTSASNEGYKLETSASNDTLNEIILACKEYDNSSIGKMYQIMSFGSKKGGLDDIVMDSFLQIKVNKQTKIVLRQELVNIADIYNAIDEEIGINNLSTYDFMANMNSKEMVDLVKKVTECVGNSNLLTTTLSMLDEEVIAVANDKLKDQDPNLHLLFDELDFSDKKPEWWKTQLTQVGEIYESFANMGIDFAKIKDKDYNGAITNLTSESFDGFIDSVFANELLDMMIDGGLKYAITKLPEDYNTVEAVVDQLITDDEVDKEIKSFSKMIDIIKSDVEFNDSGVNLNKITLSTLDKIVDTKVLEESKIANKFLTVYLANTLSNMEYDGKNIGVDKSLFEAKDFSLQNELKNLTSALIDGFGANYSINDITNIMDTAKVDNISKLLESDGLKNCTICKELVNNLMPIALGQFMDASDLEGIDWTNEYKTVSRVLVNIFGKETKLSELSSFSIESVSFKTLENLVNDNDIWSGKLLNKLLTGLVLPFMEDLDINGTKVAITVDKTKINWQSELKSLINIGLAANGGNKNESLSALTDSFSSGSIKVTVLNQIVEEIDDSKHNTVLPAFADGLLKAFFSTDAKAKDELPYIINVANTLAVDGAINLSNISSQLDGGIKDETLDALKVNVPKSEVLKNIFSDTLVNASLITNKSDITNWDDEMEGLINVAKKFENDSNVLDLNSLTSITKIKLEAINALDDNVYKSVVLMKALGSNLSSALNTPEIETWTKDDWKNELPYITEVMATLVDSNNELVIADMEGLSKINDNTLEVLKVNVPLSTPLQNMFGKTLVENGLITDPSVITNWTNEMDGLVTVAKTFEDINGDLVLSDLTSITKIKLASINSLDENVGKSYVLMKVMSDTLATPMSTDMSSWSSATWNNEMPHITSVMKTLLDSNDELDVNNLSDLNKVSDATLDALQTNVPSSIALQNMFGKTLVDNSLITDSSVITNWTNEMDGLVTVAKTFEDINGDLVLANLSSITEVSLDTINSLGDNVYKSYTLMSIMSDTLATPMSTDMSTWTSSDWKTEMPAMANVMATMVNAEDKLVVSEISGLTTIKDVTLDALQTNVPNSIALQNMFGKTLVDNSLITDSSVITNWTNEMDGLVTVAKTFEDINGDLVLANLSSITEVTLDTINSLGDNVYKSYTLMSIMSDTLATPMSTDMSTWTSSDWKTEMPAMANVMATMVNAENKLVVSEISSLTTIKDNTLVALKSNVPSSVALQNMFGKTLVDNSIIASTSDITNWNDEMDGLIPVARTLENSNNELELDKLNNISELSLETINLLGDSVYKSAALMSIMSTNLTDPMSTPTMNTWDSSKWQTEMPHIANLMATMVTPDTGLAKDRKIDIANLEMDEDSELKRATFVSIRNDVPASEALQNMFDKAMYDSLYDSENTVDAFPSQPATFNDDRCTWWDDELDGFITILLEFMGDKDSMKLSELNVDGNVKVKLLRTITASGEAASTRNDSKTNIGKSLYIQYMFKPQLRTLSKRDVSGEEFVFTNSYNWDSEMPKTIEFLIASKANYDSDGNKTALTNDDEIDITTVKFDLYDETAEMTAKEAVARNKDMLNELKNAMDNNTYLQFTAAEAVDKLADTTNMPYKRAMDWDNTDWAREMDAICSTADLFMNESNPALKKTINFNTLVKEEGGKAKVESMCTIASKSYTIQSKIAKSLINIGINACDTSALTGTSTLLEYLMNQEINTINSEYKVMMDAMYNKLDIATDISKVAADSNKKVGNKDAGYLTYTFYKDDEHTEKIVYIYGNMSTGEYDIYNGDDSNYFTYASIDSSSTNEEMITYYTERGTIKKPLSSTTDSDPVYNTAIQEFANSL